MPAEIGITTLNGRVLLNGTDIEALSAGTPRPSALMSAVASCFGDQHQYTFALEPGAHAESTRELLNEAPMQTDRVERLAFAKSAPITVRRAARTPASGHWVKLSIAPHRIRVRELRRDAGQLQAAPTVAEERELPNLSGAYAWLRSTCSEEPCAGIIFVLSPEQTNSGIASALRAISAPNAPTPRLDLRKDDDGASDELPRFGRLPPEVIQAIVRKSYGQFKTCYERGLARDAKLSGEVKVQFVIEIDGSVKNSTIASTTLPDDEVARCVVGTFTQLHFPTPEGGIVTVVYPIMLTPG